VRRLTEVIARHPNRVAADTIRLVLIEKTLPLGGWTEWAAGIMLVVWGGLTLAMTG
jgi:hypothetical protein